MNELEALEKAIEIAGGQRELAERVTFEALKLGLVTQDRPIKQQHISNWKNREKRCPSKMARAISLAVNSAIPPSLLRPDLYPTNFDQAI